MNFLDEGNLAGQALLSLVSRGNAITAELIRLSQNIPRIFREVPQGYENLIFDFRYLPNQDLYESRIENSGELIDHDRDIKENYGDVLRRFYNCFEGIFKFNTDLRRYLSELEDGVFIQLSLETIMEDGDGKQLMCEAVYLWCVMLTLLDTRIEGVVRERLIISHLRYRGHRDLPLIDDVCALCKSTGYIPSTQQRPAGYPEDYMTTRCPLPRNAVSLVTGRLRTDDIYHAARCYPLPEHRSTALAQQAGMLYLVLYLSPDVLKTEFAAMREVVDRFFPDNWVVSWYLGYATDLSVAWEPYKAAKAAVANTIASANVANCAQRNWEMSGRLAKELNLYLTEGTLTEEYILDNVPKLVACARQANVTVRWLLLHTPSYWQLKQPQFKLEKKQLQARESVGSVGGAHATEVLLFLILNTAQFEWVLKRVIGTIVDARQTRWDANKSEASNRALELADYFGPPPPESAQRVTRIKANKHLEKWFRDMASQINSLDANASTIASGRKLQQLRQALEEVEQYHDLEQSLQVRAFLADSRKFLDQMLRVCNVGPQLQAILDLISDMSYGWDALREGDTYVSLLQQRIKSEPVLVLKLRATLVKLGSILNVPLVRINQLSLSSNGPVADIAHSDLESVSMFYSSELETFARRVLEVIPRSVFELLHQIIDIQTKQIPELPSKIEKERILEYTLLDSRFLLAHATHSVSVFTEGILAMQETLAGIIPLNPKQLLEDGIRKELVFRLSQALDKVLTFYETNADRKVAELTERLTALGNILDGYSRSFQYIQDYIRLQGLKVWQEEFMRVIAFNVEQEGASFMLHSKGGADIKSRFQSREVPIPVFPRPNEADPSVNFIGRLARELLVHTDYSTSLYLPDARAWFDVNGMGKQLIGPPTFTALINGISVFGLTGLDQLYCFMIVRELQQLVKKLNQMLTQDKETSKHLAALFAELLPTTSLPREATRLYDTLLKLTKPFHSVFLPSICRVGQIQLIRQHLLSLLNLNCKVDSSLLYGTLQVLNKSLLKDVHAHYQDPANLPYPDKENTLLPELSKYLEAAGMSDSLAKIYVTAEGELPAVLPILCFAQLLAVVPKYHLDAKLGWILCPLKKDKKARHDSMPLVIGLVTLLKQFHAVRADQFVGLSCQYIRSNLNALGFQQRETASSRAAPTTLPEPAQNIAILLEMLVRYSEVPQSLIDANLPPFVFSYLHTQAN